jgi:hypothetical protein
VLLADILPFFFATMAPENEPSFLRFAIIAAFWAISKSSQWRWDLALTFDESGTMVEKESRRGDCLDL